jgi:hypothetical protein
MLNKIIYLSAAPYSDQFLNNYFVLELKKKICKQIEFWDLSKIVLKKFIFVNKAKKISLKKFSNIYEFEKAINENQSKNIIYILVLFKNFNTINIFKILQKYQIFLIDISWGLMPDTFINLEKKKNLIRFFTNVFFNNQIFKNIFTKIYFKYIFKGVDLLFAQNPFFYLSKFMHLKSIHLVDYDKYLLLKNNQNRFIKKKYIVFLDQGVTSNIDHLYSINNLNLFNKHDNYFSSLFNFFDKIEKKYQYQIVIAAHPKTSRKNAIFNKKYKVYKYKTAELVKNCEFVIAHDSLSISYAVLNLKPLLFIYTNEMALFQSQDVKNIFSLSKYLNSDLININMINEISKLPTLFKLSKKQLSYYEKYKYNFIVNKQNRNILSKEIFVKTIDKYVKKIF